MNKEPFRFKQFQIHHDRSAMKVGTDGVLLGAWVELNKPKYVLDIGTGSGLIALMIAQRSERAFIDAVEIDPESYLQAIENISISKWEHRIKIFNVDIQDFNRTYKYDTILCNPPYFKQDNKLNRSPRNLARNSRFLPTVKIIRSVKRLLAPRGKFSMIYPYTEGIEFIKLATESTLFLSIRTQIYSRKELKPERIMMQFCQENIPCQDNDLIIYESIKNRAQYTPEYISLTKDFYLYK